MSNTKDPILYLYENYGARAAWLKGPVMRGVFRNERDAGRYRAALLAVFPYFCGDDEGNISLYARGLDYHAVVSGALNRARELIEGGERARVCVDSSPLDEKKAACLAGLGVVGKNGLLITKEYGSYVFIGEILVYGSPESARNAVAPIREGRCLECGECVAACPTGFLSGKGECLSGITQKKGPLTPAEERLICENGYVWGCDICQLVCPMNAGVKRTPIAEFGADDGAVLVKSLDLGELGEDDIEKYSNRAFMWRGRDVLIRNVTLISQDFRPPADPEGAEGKAGKNCAGHEED